jgi:hypothetical protein
MICQDGMICSRVIGCSVVTLKIGHVEITNRLKVP